MTLPPSESVMPGQHFVAIAGPSGSGKTSLLRRLRGLVELSGSSDELPHALRGLPEGPAVLVPARPRLVLSWTAAENVQLPLRLAGLADAELDERAMAELDVLGCAALAQRSAAGLSDGERARVALAAALARRPPVLLVDEPTGALDPEASARVGARLREAVERGCFVVVATHDSALLEQASQVVSLPERATWSPRASLSAPSQLQPPAGALPGLAWSLTRGARARLVATVLAAGLLLSVVVAALGLGRGAQTLLVEDLLGSVPAGMVRVTTPSLGLGPFRLATEGMDSRLDDEALDALRATPGISAVHPRAFSNFPVSARFEVLGLRLVTDLALEGVEAEWLADEVDTERFRWAPGDEGPVPVVISEQLVTLFNAGFARAQGLPRLRSSALRGLQATATLGRSSFASSDRTVRIRAEVVGTSQRTAPIGAAVPIEFLEHYGRELAGGPPDWSSAVLELEADGDLDSVRAAVRAEGLRFEDDGGLGALRDAIRLVDRLGTAAVSLVCLGVVALVLLVLLGRLEGRARLLDSLELAGLPRKSLVRLALWDGLLVTVPMLGVAAAAGGLLGRAVEWLLVGRLASELGLDPSGLFAPPGPGLLLLGVVLLLLPPIGLGLRCRLRLRRPLVERLDGR